MEDKKTIVENLWYLANISIYQWRLKDINRFAEKAIEKMNKLQEAGVNSLEDEYLYDTCIKLKTETHYLRPILENLDRERHRKESRKINYVALSEAWSRFLRRLEHDYVLIEGEKVLVSSFLSYKALVGAIEEHITRLTELGKKYNTEYLYYRERKERSRASNMYTNTFLEFFLLIDIFLLRGWRIGAIVLGILCLIFPFLYRKVRINPSSPVEIRYSTKLMSVLFFVTTILAFFFLLNGNIKNIQTIYSNRMFIVLISELVGSVILGRIFGLIRFGFIKKDKFQSPENKEGQIEKENSEEE